MTTFSFLMALKFAGIAIAGIAILGFIVLKLWNWLIPELFTGPRIRFKHALGIMALSFILFGGLFKGGQWDRRYCGRHHENCPKENCHNEQCTPEKNGN